MGLVEAYVTASSGILIVCTDSIKGSLLRTRNADTREDI